MDKPAQESVPSNGRSSSSDESDATIRIEDPGYDVDRIMVDLRRRLMEESAHSNSGASQVAAKACNETQMPKVVSVELGSVPGADDLDWQLFQAEAESRQNQVADQVRVANGLIGGVVTQIRRPLHQLARFYANLIARKQRRVNERFIQVARILKQRSDDDRETIAALRAEVTVLNARLEDVTRRELAMPVGPQGEDTSVDSKHR